MVASNSKPRIGVVVPTIGGRPEYLPSALKSIAAAGERENTHILLVGNKGFNADEFLAQGLIDAYLDEPVETLAAKINWAFSQLPESVEFINWIGDDDLYTPGSISASYARIQEQDKPVLVYGGCVYIDPQGQEIFNNQSGAWAVPLLRFGPQLIPQPGSLYRRDAFDALGGLSTDYHFAFDFDLFLKLSKIGKCAYLPRTLAKFRWHPGSLSVSRRRESVAEASRVRKSHLPQWLRPISVIWDAPVRHITYLAGKRVSKKLF